MKSPKIVQYHAFFYLFNHQIFIIMSILLICLLTREVSGSEVDWTAYNDCIGTTSANPNTTTFTNYSGFSGDITGKLVNNDDGSTAEMPTVLFTIPENTTIQPVMHLNYGVNPNSGTDACNIFDGNVDFSGTILEHPSECGSECWFVEIVFTGLDPNKKYTFAGTAFRNKEYPDQRQTQCTIQGAIDYTNTSSEGVDSKIGEYTVFQAADNSNEGYIVRWENIECGPDGQFTIHTVSVDADTMGRRGYPLAGFMLQQISTGNTAPIVNAGQDRTIHQPLQYVSLTGSVSDDGLGEPAGFLAHNWTQISGPDATFTTSTDATDVTVCVPVVGNYEFQLESTDGLLTTSDTVAISVTEEICPIGDIDGDCKVNLSDIELISLNWLENEDDNIADLDGDTFIKLYDLSFLSRSWMEDWTGSLQVTISPSEVITLGAKWRVDNGQWLSSGTIVPSLGEGEHEIEYSPVADWSPPAPETVQITRDQITSVSGQHVQVPTVVINEFMAINSYIPYISDMNIYTRYDWNNSLVYPDWIELYNQSEQMVDLAGWYLTDDPDNLTKWQFPSNLGSNLQLQPNRYYILFASNKDQQMFPGNYPFLDDYDVLHTNFELGSSGEYLALVAPDGVSITCEYDDYPPQFPFTSYGIGTGGIVGYLSPTAGLRLNGMTWTGASNSDALPDKVADTNFSHKRGFYDTPFDVNISCDTDGAAIHYTLDGTEPCETVGSGTYLYTDPIQIATTTCLRARAVKSGLLGSDIDTQTYLFLDEVVNQDRPADSRYSTNWGGYPADFAMEDNTTDIKLVAGDAGYTVAEAKAVIKDALQQIPTLSVTGDPAGIFGLTDGIYTHTADSGDAWERPVSAEYFNGDPNDTFQVNCGLKLQGGASRLPYRSPKHSLSLRFRGGYGEAKLKTDIFGRQTPINRFDSLQLRAMYNNSWIHWSPEQRGRASMIRDQFIRDCLITMGQENGGAGRYIHLYINGLYWGIYNIHERPEASHYAAYYGGDGDYYDALNAGELVDGDSNSWNAMQSLVSNASGSSQSDWQAINAVVDIENVIDWTIMQCYSRNQDLSTTNNWKAAGGGVFNAPWQFYAWDVERTLEDGTVGDTARNSIYSSVFLLNKLDDFTEFRMQYTDHLYKHFNNQGALTTSSALATLDRRVMELTDAITAESARWGDYKRDVYQSTSSPYYLMTRNDFWLPAVADIDSFLQQKRNNAINYFKTTSPALYPSIEPPVFRVNTVMQSGGNVSVPYTFDMQNNNGLGDVYYTLDNTDPRQYWTGSVSGTALLYADTPIELNKSITVKSRVKFGSTWSALHETVYVDENISNTLRVTEIMYHPADPNTEFIELQNIGNKTVNLNLIQFTNGIAHTFSDVAVAPNGYVLLVQDKTAFDACYTVAAEVPVIEWQMGGLDNDGEKIELTDAIGQIIQSFRFKDGWYDLTDGQGFSLTVRDSLQDRLLWGEKEGWQASLYAGGTPGRAAQTTLVGGSIVINEILAHSHDINPDWIELYNTTPQDINISDWFLSDNNDDDPNIMKYQIPDGTVINAGMYLVFVETETFGNPSAPGCNSPFGLSEAGETVYLHSGQNDQITGYYQTEENFDASETDVTFGRYVKAELSGGYDFARMVSPTLGTWKNDQWTGAANSGPLIPDIVITEIHYNPTNGTDYEFIELYNRSNSPVTLMSDATKETSPNIFITEELPWHIEGINYTFPVETTLGAGEKIIIARNPDSYTSLPCRVFGPCGKLDNGGEQIEIQIPGDQEYGKDRYWIPIEKIDYDNSSPWPTSPDEGGHSLQRINRSAYGRDYSNWTAAIPTPGQ